MKPALTFHVIPALPARLARLRDVAYNLRWAWNNDAIELFRRLDPELWGSTNHNPVLLLGTVSQDALSAAASDEGFLAHFDRVVEDLDTYLAGESTWYARTYGASHTDPKQPLVAYFSAEFGITGCLAIFAGGLGVLSGDHLKSASDLGIPLVGIGLLYQQGYFRQYINEAGWQQEIYEDNDFHNLPVNLERTSSGKPLMVEVELPGRKVKAQIWKLLVGRITLYLLDTNVPQNSAADQNITDQLYGGDRDIRIQQEIVLGIGGFRALQALGLKPGVCHMNEGHSALLGLEWIRQVMAAQGVTFAEAREAVSAGLVFTTHTPVSAGHDFFNPDLIKHYFTDYAASLQLSINDFLGLGRQNPADAGEQFCMTTLALRLSEHANAVSALHGVVSRDMWKRLWPAVPVEEAPIHHVTNGVHFRSWASPEMEHLYDRYLGARWGEEPFDPRIWSKSSRIPAEELWHTHERRRERLVAFVRRRLRHQLEHRGATQAEIQAADEVLDAEIMTIGFARRFATYKRATLLLRDPERLARILNHPTRPVQIVYAGAAHPKDHEGKELIQKIITLSRQEQFRRRLAFVEGYGILATRYLVQGSDVWLNTPRRPMEASGTSGMKAAVNGVLNVSTLDGWWDEAWAAMEAMRDPDAGPDAPYAEPIGWAIGRAENYDDPNYQDQVEAAALYDLLERDVIPTFYDRPPNGVPRRWIARMKASINNLCHFFNSHRMVREYTDRFYIPAATRRRELAGDSLGRARSLAAWKVRVKENWPQVRAEVLDGVALTELPVGSEVRARARVRLGSLTPEEVTVELYLGQVDADNDLVNAQAAAMSPVQLDDTGSWVYEAKAVCSRSGLHGYTVRVLPRHADLTTPFLPGLIAWAGN
jgi:starch phosphorylase